MLGDGRALPWVDTAAFAKRAIEVAENDRRDLEVHDDWVFFDRGLVDAATALQHATGTSAIGLIEQRECYHQQMFIAPPWPEIFENDGERRHGYLAAVEEYDRLLVTYDALEYEMLILPKVAVEERADFVLRHLR